MDREVSNELPDNGVLDLAQKEMLLRGEMTYTDALSKGTSHECFIEDQPVAWFGVSQSLPESATADEQERLMKRLEMSARAREQSTHIMNMHYARREAVRTEMERERRKYLERLSHSQREREDRWAKRLAKSPFAVDLVAENERILKENRIRDQMEQQRQRCTTRRTREAHNAIFKRATAETDELDYLRAEKRYLLTSERQLRALRDVERSNARTAQVLQRRQHALREQLHLQTCVKSKENSGKKQETRYLDLERMGRFRGEIQVARDIEQSQARATEILQERRQHQTKRESVQLDSIAGSLERRLSSH